MADDRIHLRVARVPENWSKEHFDDLLGTMPEFIRSDLRAFKRWTDARASLVGKLVLRQLLADRQLPFTLEDLRFEHKERPCLSDTFDFNISHSGELVVVALAFDQRIGIDVEKHRPVDKNLFRKYFSDAEWEQVDTSDPLPGFFRLWSIKEAAIKCDGRGVEVLGKTSILDKETVRCDDSVFYYREIGLETGYASSLCSTSPIGKFAMENAKPF